MSSNGAISKKLKGKQLKFVEMYEGNATQAAIAAGYSQKTARIIGAQNLTKPNIVAAIRAREGKSIRPAIASREERQRFWTETMTNPNGDMRDRLKASELLGKSEADFIERSEVSGGLELVFRREVVRVK